MTPGKEENFRTLFYTRIPTLVAEKATKRADERDIVWSRDGQKTGAKMAKVSP